MPSENERTCTLQNGRLNYIIIGEQGTLLRSSTFFQVRRDVERDVLRDRERGVGVARQGKLPGNLEQASKSSLGRVQSLQCTLWSVQSLRRGSLYAERDSSRVCTAMPRRSPARRDSSEQAAREPRLVDSMAERQYIKP